MGWDCSFATASAKRRVLLRGPLPRLCAGARGVASDRRNPGPNRRRRVATTSPGQTRPRALPWLAVSVAGRRWRSSPPFRFGASTRQASVVFVQDTVSAIT